MAINLKQGLFLYEEEEEEQEQLKRIAAAEEADNDDNGSGGDNSEGEGDEDEEEEEFYEEEEEDNEEAGGEEKKERNAPQISPKPVPVPPEAVTSEAEAATSEDLDRSRRTSPSPTTTPLSTESSPPASGHRNLLLAKYLNRTLKKKEENTTPTESQQDLSNNSEGRDDGPSAAVASDPMPRVASPPPSRSHSLTPTTDNVSLNGGDDETSEDEGDLEFITAVMEGVGSANRENEVAQIFERASRDSFEGDDIIRPDEEEMEVAAEEDNERDEDDVFTPSIPIEEQYFNQEEKAAAVASAPTSFFKEMFSEPPINEEECSSSPSERRRRSLSAEVEETAIHYNEVPPVVQQSPQQLFSEVFDRVESAPFPPPKYTFNSAVTKANDEEDTEASLTMPPPPPSSPPPVPVPQTTAVTQPQTAGLLDKSAANVEGAASKRKELLDRVKKTALSIKIKMLNEQTAGMHCNELVKVLFGREGEEMRTPSLKMRQKLKMAIDAELTVKRFVEYKTVVDINTAELFMKDKNALEDISRQHIMSNPLLSSIDLDTIIPGLGESTAQQQQQQQQQQDEVMSLLGDEDSASSVKAPTSDSVAIVTPPQVSLYQDLVEIMSNPTLNKDPATRLSARITFLKKLLAYKIGNMCNISKMIGLTTFIIKQAINTIAGGAGSDRVLLSNGGVNNSNNTTIADDNLSIAGIDLLFSTIKGGVNGVIERTCVSVARLAMYMGVPVVMINWPNEFKSSLEYENILRDSILKFKNTSNVSLSFILDTVFGGEGEEDDYDEEDMLENEELSKLRKEKERHLELNEIITSKEKAAIIKASIDNGTASARDMFSAFYNGNASILSKKGEERTSTVAAPEIFYKSVSAVIEQKNRVTDNMLSGIVNGLENNKMILSKIISRLIARASLAATMYYINSSTSSSKRSSTANKDVKSLPSSTSKKHSPGPSDTGEDGSGLSRLERRRLLTSSRRRRPGRSALRSSMPLIAPPQKIMSIKSSKRSKYDALDSEELTDNETLTPEVLQAFRDWNRER